jgi:hypothetical protein
MPLAGLQLVATQSFRRVGVPAQDAATWVHVAPRAYPGGPRVLRVSAATQGHTVSDHAPSQLAEAIAQCVNRAPSPPQWLMLGNPLSPGLDAGHTPGRNELASARIPSVNLDRPGTSHSATHVPGWRGPSSPASASQHPPLATLGAHDDAPGPAAGRRG